MNLEVSKISEEYIKGEKLSHVVVGQNLKHYREGRVTISNAIMKQIELPKGARLRQELAVLKDGSFIILLKPVGEPARIED